MYIKKDEILVLDWLSYEEKSNSFKFVDNISSNVMKELHLCESGEKDCDEAFLFIQELEDSAKKEFSMFKIAQKIRKEFKKKDNVVCDITKIYLSKETYDDSFEFDYKLFKTLYAYKYTPEQARREVSKLHFAYGLAMSPEIKDNRVHILKGVFK